MDEETFLKLLAEQLGDVLRVSVVNRRTLQSLTPRAQQAGGTGTAGQTVFRAPDAGTMILRILGQGAIASVFFHDTPGSADTYTLNAGTALTLGAFYEFTFTVGKGEDVYVQGSDRVAAFWRPE